MQTEESPPSTSNPKVRIIGLIWFHVVVGLLLGVITEATAGPGLDLLPASFIGLVFSQTNLLGIWVGSGTDRWWIRLIGGLVGVGYLGPQFGICIGQPVSEIVILVAFATLIVSSMLLLTRCFGLRIRHCSDQETPATKRQFSIRHMMILTLVVACLLALAKWLQPYHLLYVWPILAVLAVASATVGLVAVWAILGAKHALIGIPVLLAVAVGAGYGMAEYLGPLPRFAIWMTVTLTESLSLVLSLFVLRSCGYRLRRRSARRPETELVEVP